MVKYFSLSLLVFVVCCGTKQSIINYKNDLMGSWYKDMNKVLVLSFDSNMACIL
jgi:hypothetical protein